MHNRFTKRGVTTLLLLALLIVGVAILLPIVASADGTPANDGEIEDLNYQTVNGTNVKTSEKTDLRFLFSIDNLDYTAVGFVFSTSNDPVKTGTKQSGNFTESTTVYRSVTANSTDIPAPDGRLWVAAKLSEIPHASFATYIYVRPYVEDGSGVRYGETKRINVCEALGHVHEIKNPEGTATLLTAGTRRGNCAVCGINNIEELDVRAAVADTLSQEKFLKGSSEVDTFDHYASVKNTLTGSQKYYPDAENGGEGRDFFFQIDMLWNETMLNSMQNKFILCFYTSSDIPLFYFTPKDYANRQDGGKAGDRGDNPWSGGFDWTNGNDTLEGPAGGWGKLFDRYPNLNRSGDEQDWGWHRIGVRVHEEAHTDGNTVTYSGVFYLYIDGVQRWKVSLNTAQLVSKNALLFTMDPDGTYHANTNDNVFTFWATNLDESTSEVQMVTANLTTSAVRPSQFSAGVVPVSDPVPSKFVLKNNTAVDARVWFMKVHDHVWDGNEVLTREATVLQAGKKAEHCKLCGAEEPTGTPVAFVPTVYRSSSSDTGYTVGELKSLSDIRGYEVFHRTSGRYARNLYFEYSFLWNSTLGNWDYTSSNAEMKLVTLRNESNNNHRELYYLYFLNDDSQGGTFNTSNDCPFKGHIDYSTYLIGCNPAQNCADDLTSEAHYFRGNLVGRYAAGWGGKRGDSPYLYDENDQTNGWHHIGVLIHQEASSPSDTTVDYSGWSELFIDGVKVWRVNLDMDSENKNDKGKYTSLKKNDLLLWSATAEDGSIKSYTEASSSVKIGYRLDAFKSTNPVYVLFGDVRWRIVDLDFDPTTEIEPVDSPAAVDYVIPGTDVHVNAAVYFKAAD